MRMIKEEAKTKEKKRKKKIILLISHSQETCSGSGGGSLPPYQDGNHFARCGYINVFHFGVAECSISEFPY